MFKSINSLEELVEVIFSIENTGVFNNSVLFDSLPSQNSFLNTSISSPFKFYIIDDFNFVSLYIESGVIINKVFYHVDKIGKFSVFRDDDSPSDLTYNSQGQLLSLSWLRYNILYRNSGYKPININYTYKNGQSSPQTIVFNYVKSTTEKTFFQATYIKFHVSGKVISASFYIGGQVYSASSVLSIIPSFSKITIDDAYDLERLINMDVALIDMQLI